MTEIPEVENTGASGKQEETSAPLVPKDQPPPFPIETTIQGLAASDLTNMGDKGLALLVSSIIWERFNQLEDSRSELASVRGELEDVRRELSDCKVRSAVLQEQVRTNRRQKHFRGLIISGGSILLGWSIHLGLEKVTVLPFLLGGIGLLIMLAGWLWPSTEKEH